MSDLHNNHPQLTKQQIIDRCKQWLGIHKNDDMSVLLGDYVAATVETDVLTYPISSQAWITEKSEPELWNIVEMADIVNNNHNNQDAWNKLVQSVELAIQTYEG